MKLNRTVVVLIFIMTVVALTILGATFGILYTTAISEKRASLLQSVKSQARLIEAISGHQIIENSAEALDHTIEHILSARENYEGFGETGEFVLGQRKNSLIDFVLRHRHSRVDKPEPVPWAGTTAEPMRKALSGESGSVVAPDYRGVKVLAAYTPVAIFNLGIVAKIDLAEVRAPFLRAAAWILGIAIFLIAVGTMLFSKVSGPMVLQLIENEQKFRDYTEATADRFWETDENFQLIYVSPPVNALNIAVEKLVGVTPWDIDGIDSADEIWNEFRADMAAHKPIRNFQFSFNKSPDRKIYVQYSALPKFDSKGKFTGYRGTTIDVTAEIQALLSTESQHHKLISAIDKAPEGIILWDATDRFVFCNQKFKELRPDAVKLLKPGVKYADFIRVIVESGHLTIPEDKIEATIKKQIAEFRSEDLERDVELSSGRWVRITKGILPDGMLVNFHTDITARKHAEEEQRNLFDLANDSIFISDPDTGNFVDVNNNAAERLGYTREELLQLAYKDINDPEVDVSTIVEELQTNGNVEAESIHIRKDGSKMHVAISSQIIDLSTHRVQQTFVRDISHRKEIELSLKESEERFSKAFQVSPMMQTITRLDNGTVVDVNDSWLSNLGFQKEEIIGNLLRDNVFLHNFSAEDRAARIEEIRQTKSSVGYETTIRKKDGDTLDLNCKADIIELGGVEHLLVVSEDITERKKSQRKIKETEQRFSAIFQSTPAMVSISTEKESEILEVNETWLRTLGYQREEVIGKSPFDLNMLLEDDVRSKSVRQLMEDEIVVVETRYRTKGGEVRDFIVSGQKINFEGRDCILFLSQDITMEKSREEHLRHAQKMEAVGQLTGGLAHDFNNLLMAALGNIEIIEENLTEAPDLMDRALVVKRAVQRGAELTKRLLAFSRRQQLDPAPTDISQLADDLRTMLNRVLPENIEINWNLPAGLWLALVDSNQLENAILNLALNSKDAMVAGGTLTISCGQTTVVEGNLPDNPDVEYGDFVTVLVGDTGMGIRTSDLRKIFDPFYTTKGVGEGSGLGLSMVYGFVRQTGGFVDIESVPTEGTKITLYLPRVKNKMAPVRQVKGQDRQAENYRGNGERILVIEDEPEVRETTISLLELLGYEVIDGNDGEDIANIIEDSSFDLVLSDVVLSNKMSGTDVIEMVLEQHKSAKAVLMTGYAEQDIIHSSDGALKFPVISKPFTREELGQKIFEILNNADS